MDNGVEQSTPALLTSEKLVPPKSIEKAWYHLKVKLYVPNPLWCFHCQVLDTAGHQGNDKCPGMACRYHCKEADEASSKQCNRYKFEKKY